MNVVGIWKVLKVEGSRYTMAGSGEVGSPACGPFVSQSRTSDEVGFCSYVRSDEHSEQQLTERFVHAQASSQYMYR